MSGKVLKVDAGSPSPQIIDKAAALVSRGEVIVCPTDTGYAFAADALDTAAIARVYALKGRSFTNPMHMAVSSLEDAEKYAVVGGPARKLAGVFLPGALTMVLPRKETVPPELVGGRDTVGIRVPANEVILGLARLTGLPLTTTSANVSGMPTPYDIDEIARQYGEEFDNIATVLDQGAIEPRELSTIVDLTAEPPRLLRQGRIPWEKIQKVLQK